MAWAYAGSDVEQDNHTNAGHENDNFFVMIIVIARFTIDILKRFARIESQCEPKENTF